MALDRGISERQRRLGIATPPVICLLCFLTLAFGPGLAFAGPVRSLQEIRQEGVVVQQWDTSCGAAALATVLTYSLQVPVSEREVADRHVEHDGADQSQTSGRLLVARHEALCRDAWPHRHRLSRHDLGATFGPSESIVPILQYGNPHFIVVRGLDSYGRVNIADPGFGNRTMSVARFEAVWQGGIGFVVTR